MRFKIYWASLIVGSKFTVFAFVYFVFEESFSKYKPPGAYIWRSDLPEGFVRYRIGGLYLEGLIHGGAYFRNFTVLRSHCGHFNIIFQELRGRGGGVACYHRPTKTLEI